MSQKSSPLRRPNLAPSEVRARVSEEHHRLRVMLTELQELARLVCLDEGYAPELRRSLRELLIEFALHLDSEDEILLPLVERVDAWGPERGARMREEHALQRAMLQVMFDRAEHATDDAAFATEVDALVLRIFHDMREEEAELLDETLLRDDSVAIDQNCG